MYPDTSTQNCVRDPEQANYSKEEIKSILTLKEEVKLLPFIWHKLIHRNSR